jgi:hypothetical protein
MRQDTVNTAEHSARYDLCFQLVLLYASRFLTYPPVLFSVALPAHSGPRLLIQFRNNFSQTVGLLDE